MIIDSHMHIFPPMGGPSGHRSTREHLRYVQQMLLFHHTQVRRADTNEVVEHEPLYDGQDLSLAGLTEAGYRGGGHGRFAWTLDGVEYRRQYLPPTLANLASPAEQAIAQMDYAGVDRAVLQTGHAYGRLNRYISGAVRKYPDRFWGLAMVDEWKANDQSQIHALNRAIGQMGLHALWFYSGSLALHGVDKEVDDRSFHPFWDHVRELGIPVFWFVLGGPGRDDYLSEVAAFGRWNERYPEIPVMFTHGHPLGRFMEGDRISIPEAAWKPLTAPNVVVELLIPVFHGARWEYPYHEARPIVREYYDRLGPDHLAWASDMPNVERHCTYRQSLDYLRLHYDFISDADMNKICGDNTARLFGE